MISKFYRRVMTAGATALVAGTALIPQAAAADLSQTVKESIQEFLWNALNTIYWIPAGISMELGIFDLLGKLSGN